MRLFQTTILIFSACALLSLWGCKSIPKADDIEAQLPDECSIPAGVEVVSIALDENQAGDINGVNGYDVTVTLNRALVTGEHAIICYAVRDVQLITPKIIAVGFVGILANQGSTVTRADNFQLSCDGENDVQGAQTSLLEDLNDTSKENSTKIYVQHVSGVQSFLQIPTGIQGVKSNKIRVSCP